MDKQARARLREMHAKCAPVWHGAVARPQTAADALTGDALLWAAPPHGPRFETMDKCRVVSEADGLAMLESHNSLIALLDYCDKLEAEREEMRKAIRGLLDIIHDDLTHARQADHADAISKAKEFVK